MLHDIQFASKGLISMLLVERHDISLREITEMNRPSLILAA